MASELGEGRRTSGATRSSMWFSLIIIECWLSICCRRWSSGVARTSLCPARSSGCWVWHWSPHQWDSGEVHIWWGPIACLVFSPELGVLLTLNQRNILKAETLEGKPFLCPRLHSGLRNWGGWIPVLVSLALVPWHSYVCGGRNPNGRCIAGLLFLVPPIEITTILVAPIEITTCKVLSSLIEFLHVYCCVRSHPRPALGSLQYPTPAQKTIKV